ncbi:MAG: hypothetical protein JST78_09585 [Bacteroidetes bacterium]|nr:hypothetical protein [Bacteroidota bacterium]
MKKFSPYAMGGAVGAVIHRLRTEMNLFTFFKSVVTSIFISIWVGIIFKDYLKVENENLIFVACGVSGTFSKIILDEVEQVIKMTSDYLRAKFIGKKDTNNE